MLTPINDIKGYSDFEKQKNEFLMNYSLSCNAINQPIETLFNFQLNY